MNAEVVPSTGAKRSSLTFDVQAGANRLIELLKPEGFKGKQTQAKDRYWKWLIKNPERAVNVALEGHDDYGTHSLQITVSVRDSRGRMKLAGTKKRTWIVASERNKHYEDPAVFDTHLQNLAREIGSLRGEEVSDRPIKTIKDLDWFKPLDFTKPQFEQGEKEWANWVYLKHAYVSAMVKGIASIARNLKVSVDDSSTPDAECWFYIIGSFSSKQSGAAPEIIVTERDGRLVYYPVRMGKVTNDLTPTNTYIDYKAFTELDSLLIQRAIEYYLSRFGA